jgi:hypothetical protein
MAVLPFLNENIGMVSRGIPNFVDVLNEIYGATYFARHHSFYHGFGVLENGYVPKQYLQNPSSPYPISQILLASLHWISGLSIYHLTTYLAIVSFVIISILVFFFMKTLYGNEKHALLGAILFPTSNFMSREIIWATPHSLIATILMLLTFLQMMKINRRASARQSILLTATLVVMSLIHTYTLVMTLVAVGVYLSTAKVVRLRSLLLISVVTYFLIVLMSPLLFGGIGGKSFSLLKFPLEFLALYTYPSNSPIDRPPNIFDLPAIWGYGITIVGIYGLYKLQNKNIKRALAAIFLLSTGFALTHYFGLYFLVFRNAFFASFSLLIATPEGIKQLCKVKLVRLRITLLNQVVNVRTRHILVISFIIAQTLAGLVFQTSLNTNLYPFLALRFPPKDDLNAINWISQNVSDNTTILVETNYDHFYARWVPILSGKRVTFGNIYFREQPNIVESLRMTLLGKLILLDPSIVEYKNASLFNSWKRDFNSYIMTTNPSSVLSSSLMKEYGIQYIYTWDASILDLELSSNFNYIQHKFGQVIVYERKS